MADVADLKRQGDERLRAGDPEAARAAFERALEAARSAADARAEAAARQGLGRARLAVGDGSGARPDLEVAFEAHLRAGDAPAAAAALGYLGQAATLEDAPARAALLLEWALALHRAGEDRLAEAFDLEAQGMALWQLEATAAALGAWWEARRIYREVEHPAADRVEGLLAGYAEEIGPDLADSMLRDLSANAEARRREGVERAHVAAQDDTLLRRVSQQLQETFGAGHSE